VTLAVAEKDSGILRDPQRDRTINNDINPRPRSS
jgi:hypothetical protein